MSDLFARLAAPFPPHAIHWRAQLVVERNGSFSALALAFIDARDVMNRLDDVCTPAGWTDSYHETPKGRTIGTIAIKVGDEWISKSDGAGDTDVEGEKGSLSDAMKRTAVKWGIGRYLYSLTSVWADCEVLMRDGKPSLNQKGKPQFKAWTRKGNQDLEKALTAIGSTHAPASTPSAEPAIKTITNDQRDIIAGLAEAANVPLLTVCEGYGIKDLRELPADLFESVKKRLNLSIDKITAAADQKKAA